MICLDGKKLLGIIAIHDQRPFSLDAKLPDLDRYLPPAKHISKIRLLAIEKGHRHHSIFPDLMAQLASYADEQGYDLGLISGTVRQTKLYRHIGFEPFGPLVGTEEAQYQPMYLTVPAYRELKERSQVFRLPGGTHKRGINLLPGPVAAQLSLTGQPGVVLVNGEFGLRLVDHARRHGLRFDTIQEEEGKTFSHQLLREKMEKEPALSWLWATHCETSTGVVNDLSVLDTVCQEQGIRLSLDCISSIGTLPVNLECVYLATSVSGKAMGSMPNPAAYPLPYPPINWRHCTPPFQLATGQTIFSALEQWSLHTREMLYRLACRFSTPWNIPARQY